MKLILVTAWYLPEQVGGTEIYVHDLAKELTSLGHEVVVGVPHENPKGEDRSIDGIRVHFYPRVLEFKGEMNSHGAFVEWVRSERADAVHFHSWTPDAGWEHFQLLSKMGIRTLLTVHSSALFCPRGTMKRWGNIICDGELRPVRCAACHAEKQGLPAPLGIPLMTLASLAGTSCFPVPGRGGTLLRLPSAFMERKRQLAELWRLAFKIVAPCEWLHAALLKNGCPPNRLRLIRQGTAVPRGQKKVRKSSSALKFGFLGRNDPDKGLNLALEAFHKVAAGTDTILEIVTPTLKETRILNPQIFRRTLEGRESVAEWLSSLDALIVPSRTLETGPLVVYEAMAVGTPIIGSRQGGIAELVMEGKGGFLFHPDSVEDLIRVLKRVISNPEILPRIESDVIRSMRDVALEMEQVYQESG